MRLFSSVVKIPILLALLFIVFSCKENNNRPGNNISLPFEEQTEARLRKMTLEEKIDMLSGMGMETRPNERLGIPAFKMSDGPLGVRKGHSTSFPAGVCMAATWDTVLIYNTGIALAKETRTKGRNFLLGPCINIQRHPLGGRNFESYGEDPYLTSRMAVAWIKGLQSQKIISSVKHYALNNQEWERNNLDVIIEERALREIYLPAFYAAVNEADAWSVMTSFNMVNGQHCSQHYHLIQEILKGEWGYQNLVISDWVSVYNTIDATNAGLDLEMPEGVLFKKDSLIKAIQQGRVKEETINDKVRRHLLVKFKAGLFNETAINRDSGESLNLDNQNIALQIAQKGIVLLKNEKNILPIDRDKIKSIAIIGPCAALVSTGGGGSSFVNPTYSVSPLEGIKNKAGNKIKVEFTEGDKFKEDHRFTNLDSKYLFTPDDNEVNGLLGEYFNNMDLSGKPIVSRIDKQINFTFEQNPFNPNLASDFFSVRWMGRLKINESGSYKISVRTDDGVRIYLDEKLIIDEWRQQVATYSSEIRLDEQKYYNIKIEYYEKTGLQEIVLGLDRITSGANIDLVASAVELAKKSDIAILFVGSTSSIESEGYDKSGLELPFRQDELVDKVSKVNPNTVVVLTTGNPVKMDKWHRNVLAIIDMFFCGQETGNAIADILFGDINPSGKLPFSFIKDDSQSPVFKGYKDKSLKSFYNEGIFLGYRYLDKNHLEPQYPFGFGLSYTNFEYKDLNINELENNEFEISLQIKNTGKIKGDEIAQLYISDKECSVIRPEKELKAFSRVSLLPGEQKTVHMKIGQSTFAFYSTAKKNWTVEPGEFEILIGSSSRDIKLSKSLTIK